MALLDKFETAAAIRDQLRVGGHDPTQVVMEQIISPTEGIVEGRHTILAGTNNYLGLTFDPACIEAGHQRHRDPGNRHHGVTHGQRKFCSARRTGTRTG